MLLSQWLEGFVSGYLTKEFHGLQRYVLDKVDNPAIVFKLFPRQSRPFNSLPQVTSSENPTN